MKKAFSDSLQLTPHSFGRYRFTPKMHSFAPQRICANTTSVPLICSSHGYHLRQLFSLIVHFYFI
jgi:hypothetical protein